MSQELAQQIAKLAASQEKLAALLSRNPEKEYVYGEAFVGNNPLFAVPLKSENVFAFADAGSQFTLAANLNPQTWEVIYCGYEGGLVVNNTDLMGCLRLEFDDTINFPRPEILYSLMEVTEYVESYTTNTGWYCFRHQKKFDIRKRYLRVTFGRFANSLAGPNVFVPTSPAAFFAEASPMIANVFGQ